MLSLLPQTSTALPVYIGASFCVVFTASFFASTLFLSRILAELKKGKRVYRVQLIKDRNDKSA